jgi:hypothetical protein
MRIPTIVAEVLKWVDSEAISAEKANRILEIVSEGLTNERDVKAVNRVRWIIQQDEEAK